MADPQAWAPPESDFANPSQQVMIGGHPVLIKPATPVKPEFIPGTRGQVFDPNTGGAKDIPGFKPAPPADKNSYAVMSHDDKVALGLDPSMPYFKGSDGLPKLPEGAKAGQAPIDPAVARDHAIQLLGAIDHANTLLSNPLTSGLPGSILGHVPGSDAYTMRSLIGDTNDPNNPGQITGDLRQQGIAYLRALNGGNGVGTVARSQSEQSALQAAMSNIRQGLPKEDLQKSLGSVRQLYLSGIARSYNLNPDDPAIAHILATTPTDKLLPTLQGLGAQPQPAPQAGQMPPAQPNTGEHITSSNALPLTPNAPQVGVSGESQMAIDPALAKIAPQLTQYLNADPKKVSNSMIIGFMQKNGVNPIQTNLMPLLEMRASGKYKGFTVDPTANVPLHGLSKVRAAVDAANPGGVPIGATLVGAADAASLGGAPDVAGIIHAVTGLGPSRSDVVAGRDISAAENPGPTLLGNILGGISPLPGAGEAGAIARTGKAVGTGSLYGFLGADDPSISNRLWNAGVGGLTAGLTHGAFDVGGRLAQGGYRAAAQPIESFVNGSEATADKYALNTAARKMPTQSLADVQTADAAATKAGVPAPAAASINRAGQDYLARTASGSPAARAVADQVANDTRKAIPQQLAEDFNSAIEAAAPRGVQSSEYLNRPVREISSDIQSMAGREFERGIEPIKSAKLNITPEVISDLDHERVQGAVRDALANHNLSEQTREELRTLIPQLKTVSGAPEFARQQYAKGIPLTVDGARNIATALDRTAGKMMDGTEGQVELSRLSRDIRGAIAEQFPEYGPVNERYASRMRAKEAMFSARQNFLTSTPEGQDALAQSSRRYTDEPNAPEYRAAPVIAENGFKKPVQPLPSNRQLAMTGAREATQIKAGESGGATADRLANNPNQQANNATVLGPQGADTVASRAGVRATNAQAVDRVQNSGTGDQTERWWKTAMGLVAAKATGGVSHSQLAHAATGIPGMSSQDAARVVRLYLNADSAPQVLQSLSSAYGARRARFIMARMAAVTAASAGVRGFRQPPDK